MTTSKKWWATDVYQIDRAVPDAFELTAGPKGLALVRAWPNETTDPGWGLLPTPNGPGFMERYERGEFRQRSVLYGYEHGKWAFAFVMRSTQLVCIDVDGKNDGFAHIKRLGMLPPTLAETSKSGNGLHLFYRVDEPWHPARGFGSLADRIGLEQGIDIRAVGCVFHHPQQRWNDRPVADLPRQLHELLSHREEKRAAVSARIADILITGDEVEVLMLHDELLAELAKPIPTGRRNNTLFAIGTKLKEAEVPEWDTQLHQRAIAVGLDQLEADKLVANVDRYGVSV